MGFGRGIHVGLQGSSERGPEGSHYPNKRAEVLMLKIVPMMVALASVVGCGNHHSPSVSSIHKGPNVSAYPSSIDLGTIGSLSYVETRIKLVNEGTLSVNISGAKPGCRCLTTDIEEALLSPGEETYFTVRYAPQDSQGAVEDSIVIELDGGERSLEIKIRAHIEDSLRLVTDSTVLSAPVLNIETFPGVVCAPKVVAIMSLDRKPFTIESLDGPERHV